MLGLPDPMGRTWADVLADQLHPPAQHRTKHSSRCPEGQAARRTPAMWFTGCVRQTSQRFFYGYRIPVPVVGPPL